MEIKCTADEYMRIVRACIDGACWCCALCPVCKYERNIRQLVTEITPTKEEAKE